MKLSEIMINDALVPVLTGVKRDAVIEELVASLAEAGAIAKDETQTVIKAIIKR